MISNYNLDCGYHNFELKDRIYLVPDYALKVIYTDGFNEVVFQGDSSNVTLLEGHEITFQEETSFDERFKFSKVLSLKVNGYKTFNDLDYRYMAIIETKDSEFYLVNVDFPSFVTHTYTLNANTNETELVFSSQSNIATLKLTNFEPNNVNSCNEYSTPKVKKFKLTESWASSLSTWQKSLVNKGSFSDIEPLQDSISLTEEFDGEKYTVTLGFDIPMSHFKNDWHIKLLQFEENKYRGYISLQDGNKAFVGYNVGLFPSYSINGDIISIRLTETAIRGIAYGDDYAVINSNIPSSIELSGATCKSYNFESSCEWNVESKPNYITITPMSGNADTQYTLQVCNTDDETVYAVSEFIIKSCNAVVKPEIVIKNRIYRWVDTNETMCVIEPIERTVSGDPYCDNCDKYIDVFNEVSYDNGETWQIASSSSTLIEADSEYCKEYRTTQSGDTYCDNSCKYAMMVTEVRCGDGEWQYSSSAETLVERNSLDCGYYGYFTIKSLEDDNTITFTSGGFPFNAGSNYNMTDYYLSYHRCVEGEEVPCGGYETDLNHYKHFGTDVDTLTISGVSKNEEIVFWGSAKGKGSIGKFDATKNYEIKGNIKSLANNNPTTISLSRMYHSDDVSSVFGGLFSNSATLVKADGLKIYTGQSFTNQCDYCYSHMFAGCTNLLTVPELPDTELYKGCYSHMFANCTSLTNVPSNMLPANSLAVDCYSSMFSGCTSLTATPVLSATTIANYCYGNMFNGCTSLTAVTELPSKGIKDYCYYQMFKDCTSLTTASVFPQEALSDIFSGGTNSLMYMFAGCTSLTTPPIAIPKFNNTGVNGYIVYGMFSGCTSLTKAPIVHYRPSYDVYKYTFADCTSLNEVYYEGGYGIMPKQPNWLKNVAPTGTFTKSITVVLPPRNENGIPSGWTIENYDNPPSYDNCFAFIANEDCSFTWNSQWNGNVISYSVDSGETWSEFSSGFTTPTISSGNKVLFKGYCHYAYYEDERGKFTSTGSYDVEGNLMFLVYGDAFSGQTGMNYRGPYFNHFFRGDTNLHSAENLILASTLTDAYEYSELFKGCTSLVKAPKILPATTLTEDCYESMFSGCTSLTTAPEIYATTLASGCCRSMFAGCTSLTTAPQLSAVTMEKECYYTMFQGCTSLTTVPQLPATTLAESCYRSMFNSCTSLTTVPSNMLPATTLSRNCYYAMFNNCTSLTASPVLSAATLVISCYQAMFGGCSSLNRITCLATDISASDCTYAWVQNVASTGTFIKDASMNDWRLNDWSGVPSNNWTVIDYTG